MRTEKQRIVKQVLHTSFFPGSRISHLQRGRTSLFENHLTGFNVGSGEHHALQHHQWGQKTALFLAMFLLSNTETHMNLPVWYFSAQQEAKLWISLLFSVKMEKKEGKWLRKDSPNIQGRNRMKLFLLLFKEKDTEKALIIQKKKGSIITLKSLVLQELKVFKASRMTRLSTETHIEEMTARTWISSNLPLRLVS